MLKCCIHLPALAGQARPPPPLSLKTIEPAFVKSFDSFGFCGHLICHIGIQITSAA